MRPIRKAHERFHAPDRGTECPDRKEDARRDPRDDGNALPAFAVEELYPPALQRPEMARFAMVAFCIMGRPRSIRRHSTLRIDLS
ncbi:hypothetical protein B5V46_11175 [Rhodovulum sp. MB263]|nr:hypothetical protein B5V46_11175 [Rhodovulum sp. MB263]